MKKRAGIGNSTIMVVDDNPANVDLLNKLLDRHGYKVRPLTNSRFALQSALSNPPDLVLLDIRMPNLDGFTFCRKLKEHPEISDVPVIFISAIQEAGDKLKAFEAGGVDYITKPFQEAEVLARVETHVELYRARTEIQAYKELLEQRVAERTAELHEANRQLRESQVFNQSLLNSSPDIIYIYDVVEKRNIYSNEGIIHVLGYSVEEVKDLEENLLPSLMHPEDLDIYQKEILVRYQKLKDGELIEHEYRMKHKDGRWCWLNSRESIFQRLPNRKPKQIFGVVSDITERKRIEEELHTTQMHYTDFINASSDAVSYWKVPDGLKTSLPVQEQIDRMYQSVCVGANRACWESYGFKRKDEMIGRRYIELIKERTFDQTAAAFVNNNYRLNNCLMHERSLQGVEYYGLVNWYGVVENGNLISTWVSAKDITELKLAEEEALRLRNLLKNIVDSMPSMLIGINTEGKVTEWNIEAEKITGIKSKQAQGKILTDMLPYFASEMDKITKAIQERQVQKDEKVARRTNGQTVYSDITVYPLMTNCTEGAVVRIDDITDRVRLEEMMVQAEKMATVGGLAAGMAHEINNPLGVIVQGVQTIERRLSVGLPANHEAAQQYQVTLDTIRAYLDDRQILKTIERIKEAGARATGIVKNMLQFSRRSDVGKKPVVLKQLIDHTIELAANDYDLKKRYDFRDIRLECDYDPALREILCAPTEIEQVLLNLLKNAAQAISEVKGECEPRIWVRTRQEGDLARIEVQDNGPGMSEEVRRRVFEPFFTTKEVGIGTGLGLSVSYMIITDKHQGTVTVDSSPGNGARFTLTLPITGTDYAQLSV